MSIPDHIRADLQKLSLLIRQGRTTQQDISESTSVDQSQVSRILSGKIKRVSPNVLALSKHAQSLGPSVTLDISSQELITEAALRLWDGSPEHALALQQFFNSLAVLHDTVRSKN